MNPSVIVLDSLSSFPFLTPFIPALKEEFPQYRRPGFKYVTKRLRLRDFEVIAFLILLRLSCAT